MSDLVEFLRARLDEDERVAHKAASLCGCHPEAPSWSFGDESTDGRILVVDDPHPGIQRRLRRRWNGSYEGLFMAEHIARHDPARVLAEVESKRRIMARHCRDPFWADDPIRRDVCFGCGCSGPMEEPNTDHVDECPELRDLASVYADHPDYRQEWALSNE